MCIGQWRIFYASVGEDNLLGGVGIEFLGVFEVFLCAEFLVELGCYECGWRLCAGIRPVAVAVGVPGQPESACRFVFVGALDDVGVEDLSGDGGVCLSACCLADVQKGEGNPAHVVGEGVLEHLVVRGGVGCGRAAGRCTSVVVGLVLVPELDVAEVFVGQGAVDVLVPLVVVDDDVDGVCLSPVSIEGIRLVAVVEDALALYHKGLDEGIGHGVALRLEGVGEGAVEALDGWSLGTGH